MIAVENESAEVCAKLCPVLHERTGLWLYGNVRLLGTELACVSRAFDTPHPTPDELDHIETDAEILVLDGKTLVVGVHNPAHMRSAVVPLRWGSPRIVVFSGGFRYHLGGDLNEEPFRAARLWRYKWDPITDLAVSRRAPDKRPTFALANPTVERLISEIVLGNRQDLRMLPGLKAAL